MKKILILTVKAGAGHLRAAQAMEAIFRERYPEIEVKLVDCLEYTNAAFKSAYIDGYKLVAGNLPSLWGRMYESMEESSSEGYRKKLLGLFDKLNSQPLRKMVTDYKPDAILCTHFFPLEALSRRRIGKKIATQFHTILTDFDIHPMWIHSITDQYYVSSPEMVYALKSECKCPTPIQISGIPVFPEFSQKYPPKEEMRKKLNIDIGKPTILLAAGGYGLIPLEEIVPALAEEIKDAQFLIIAGKNKTLQGNLQKLAKPFGERVKILGFVNNIHEYMAACEFIITKSGGLTTSECLAMGLPMLIIKPIPGQEERNATFMLEKGAAVLAHTPLHLIYKTKQLLEDRDKLNRMSRAALECAKPNSAQEIADNIVKGL